MSIHYHWHDKINLHLLLLHEAFNLSGHPPGVSLGLSFQTILIFYFKSNSCCYYLFSTIMAHSDRFYQHDLKTFKAKFYSSQKHINFEETHVLCPVKCIVKNAFSWTKDENFHSYSDTCQKCNTLVLRHDIWSSLLLHIQFGHNFFTKKY